VPFGHHPQPARDAGDRDRTVEVGPCHRGPEPFEGLQRRRVRVSVVVAQAYRHERHPGVDRRQERRVLIPGSVMGHLEHLRRQFGRMLPQQRRLGGRFDVPGHQHADPVDLRAPDHAGVVLRGPVARIEFLGQPVTIGP